jgi:single-strand DNA-binding protein
MNKVFLIGNLTRDPELRQTPNGVSVCSFSLAVQRDYADNNGERVADFFNITVWREKGENCHKYLKKGKKACVVGTLQNRKYEDSDGAVRNVTEIIASDVEFLSPKDQEEGETVVASTNRSKPQLEEIKDQEFPWD